VLQRHGSGGARANKNRFPYIDTLKITEKFGPGSQFYGFGSAEELDDLEKRLEGGERFLALFTEFPGNPLLRSPDLERIRHLADKYDFCVVVDETIGNFINVNVLPYADVVVSSLTKVFSGDSNVMGGGQVFPLSLLHDERHTDGTAASSSTPRPKTMTCSSARGRPTTKTTTGPKTASSSSATAATLSRALNVSARMPRQSVTC
jgi:cystathionine beta-lyase/cystathionine gamma-synthase